MSRDMGGDFGRVLRPPRLAEESNSSSPAEEVKRSFRWESLRVLAEPPKPVKNESPESKNR